MRRHRLGAWRVLGLALCMWLVCPLARADAPALQVRVSDYDCPSVLLLQERLAPLVPGVGPLEVSPRAFGRVGALQASVRDLGTQYQVAVGGVRREFDDPLRDCVERARVAAVFIALNLQADAAHVEQPAAALPQLGAALFGAGAYAPQPGRATLGVGADLWLAFESLRFGAGARVLSPLQLPLRGLSTPASVALLRVPLQLYASYLFELGALRVGPTLGLAFELLHVRGVDVLRPRSALRLAPGIMLAADAQLPLTAAWSLALRAAVTGLARGYALNVDPTGKLATTPTLALDLSLGISWSFP